MPGNVLELEAKRWVRLTCALKKSLESKWVGRDSQILRLFCRWVPVAYLPSGESRGGGLRALRANGEHRLDPPHGSLWVSPSYAGLRCTCCDLVFGRLCSNKFSLPCRIGLMIPKTRAECMDWHCTTMTCISLSMCEVCWLTKYTAHFSFVWILVSHTSNHALGDTIAP